MKLDEAIAVYKQAICKKMLDDISAHSGGDVFHPFTEEENGDPLVVAGSLDMSFMYWMPSGLTGKLEDKFDETFAKFFRDKAVEAFEDPDIAKEFGKHAEEFQKENAAGSIEDRDELRGTCPALYDMLFESTANVMNGEEFEEYGYGYHTRCELRPTVEIDNDEVKITLYFNDNSQNDPECPYETDHKNDIVLAEESCRKQDFLKLCDSGAWLNAQIESLLAKMSYEPAEAQEEYAPSM